jgi:hypothetical protein
VCSENARLLAILPGVPMPSVSRVEARVPSPASYRVKKGWVL